MTSSVGPPQAAIQRRSKVTASAVSASDRPCRACKSGPPGPTLHAAGRLARKTRRVDDVDYPTGLHQITAADGCFGITETETRAVTP